jgi:1,2-diacylglycerol 3-beta-glucosyltransferase
MSDFAETISPDLEPDFFPGYSGRRLKAAFALSMLWSGTAFLHVVTWGQWAILSFTVFIGVYLLKVIAVNPKTAFQEPASLAGDDELSMGLPYVSVLVAAKNEEAVIQDLVNSICQLDYPHDRFDLWVIDDNSSDRTGKILDALMGQYPRLNVVHRSAEATGGKSGALNLVWPRTKGDILVVFDADAQLPIDLLQRVVPLFQTQEVGAVQVRKAIANASTNFWTRGQQAEMALDSYYQQQRIAVGGLGELRGNGQFVRRSAIIQCGGWNEETITDDLDLTLQLHLQHWDIGFLLFPAVREEGVTRGIALWHQRNRWAEGGYQRYLDYWRQLTRNRLGRQKTLDLFVFWVLQYMLPMVVVPDFLFAIAKHRMPLFSPLTTLAFSISFWGMFVGIRRTQQSSIPQALWQTMRGTLYMLHWILVMGTTTIRIAVLPKRLKWVKTVHERDQEPVIGL